jgi:hypothetical protein
MSVYSVLAIQHCVSFIVVENAFFHRVEMDRPADAQGDVSEVDRASRPVSDLNISVRHAARPDAANPVLQIL